MTRTVYISFANDSASPEVINSTDAPELDFKAINQRAIETGAGEIRVIEFRYNGRCVGTVLF